MPCAIYVTGHERHRKVSARARHIQTLVCRPACFAAWHFAKFTLRAAEGDINISVLLDSTTRCYCFSPWILVIIQQKKKKINLITVMNWTT